MSLVTDKIREEVKNGCNNYYRKNGYDYWNDHIKYVVKNAIDLAQEYSADVEIVELGDLLHDIAEVREVGPCAEHHIYGAKIALELLTELDYPVDKIKKVQDCIMNHRGSIDYLEIA